MSSWKILRIYFNSHCSPPPPPPHRFRWLYVIFKTFFSRYLFLVVILVIQHSRAAVLPKICKLFCNCSNKKNQINKLKGTKTTKSPKKTLFISGGNFAQTVVNSALAKRQPITICSLSVTINCCKGNLLSISVHWKIVQ